MPCRFKSMLLQIYLSKLLGKIVSYYFIEMLLNLIDVSSPIGNEKIFYNCTPLQDMSFRSTGYRVGPTGIQIISDNLRHIFDCNSKDIFLGDIILKLMNGITVCGMAQLRNKSFPMHCFRGSKFILVSRSSKHVAYTGL